ncbi:MAG: hypothetical protein AAFN17_06460 [Pseudomonadota bacterium]
MTRMMDELEDRPSQSPTPQEVDRILARANAMRNAALVAWLTSFWRTLAEAIQPARSQRSA